MSQGYRSAPLPPGWAKIRLEVLTRDRHICYVCGTGPASEVDHLVPEHLGGTHSPSNLAAICTRCHRSKTGREAAQARAARYSRRRPPESHPGRKAER